MRVGASRTAPEPRNLSSTEPHSPRLRNPNQLRRGERYPLHTAPKWGQSWTPIEGQSSTPIDMHSHLIPSCPHADLCGASGRTWLFHQVLPEDERLAVERHLREFDRLGEDLKVIERDLARSALGDEGVKRLMTIPGVDMVVALAIAAAIGDVGRFEQSQKLVSYLGLNPSVRQSGPGPAYHGRITKQGRGHARGMLVEAAWAAARAPG